MRPCIPSGCVPPSAAGGAHLLKAMRQPRRAARAAEQARPPAQQHALSQPMVPLSLHAMNTCRIPSACSACVVRVSAAGWDGPVRTLGCSSRFSV